MNNLRLGSATRLVRLGLAVVLAGLLIGCGSDESQETAPEPELNLPAPVFEEGTSMAALQQAGRIRVGTNFDQPGFGLREPDTGELTGFDIEIAELMAQRIFGGTKQQASERIDYVETVALNRAPFLQDNKVDLVLATYTINDTRQQLVDFAGPYYEAEADIMVDAQRNDIASITDLNGKTVCTASNSTYEQALRQEAPLAQVDPRNTYAQCTQALRDGEVDAVATDNVILAGLAMASGNEFKLVGASFAPEDYGIGIKNDDDVFSRFLNTALLEVMEEGLWAEAFETTLGQLGLDTPTPPEIVIPPEETSSPGEGSESGDAGEPGEAENVTGQ